MQGPKLDNLINRCAEVASKGKNVTAFVLLYQTKDGAINYHRDGQASTQVVMLEIAKRGVINGLFDQSCEEE